jgi:hypothetical protein
MSLFVAEGIDNPGRRLFTLLGVDYLASPYAWVNLPLMIAVGILVAYFTAPAEQAAGLVLIGIGYGLLIVAGMFVHGLGHIVSSRLVKAPVSYILVTATVTVTHYDDDGPQPSRVHVGRSLGGPLAAGQSLACRGCGRPICTWNDQ